MVGSVPTGVRLKSRRFRSSGATFKCVARLERNFPSGSEIDDAAGRDRNDSATAPFFDAECPEAVEGDFFPAVNRFAEKFDGGAEDALGFVGGHAGGARRFVNEGMIVHVRRSEARTSSR